MWKFYDIFKALSPQVGDFSFVGQKSKMFFFEKKKGFWLRWPVAKNSSFKWEAKAGV